MGDVSVKMNLKAPRSTAQAASVALSSPVTNWLPERDSTNQAKPKAKPRSSAAPEPDESPWYNDPSALRGF
jgi:hypothetical protein